MVVKCAFGPNEVISAPAGSVLRPTLSSASGVCCCSARRMHRRAARALCLLPLSRAPTAGARAEPSAQLLLSAATTAALAREPATSRRRLWCRDPYGQGNVRFYRQQAALRTQAPTRRPHTSCTSTASEPFAVRPHRAASTMASEATSSRYSVEPSADKAADGTTPLYLTLTDADAGLRACISPANGAEISSLQVRRGGGGGGEYHELLYRANKFEAPAPDVGHGWQGKGPWLWPAVGRSYTDAQLEAAGPDGALDACKYTIDGVTRDIPVHGFLMGQAFELAGSAATDDGGASVTCTLLSDTLGDRERAAFPFAFKMSITYTLAGGKLTCKTSTENTEASGDTKLPFSIGNHVTFNFPFDESADGAAWDKGFVRGSPTSELKLTSRSLLSGASEARPELAAAGGLPLSSSNPDACNMVLGIAPDDAAFVELVQPGAFGIRVETSGYGIDDGGAASAPHLLPHRYFVFWGSPEDKFFCPEPWMGGPNSLNTGDGCFSLAPGQTGQWSFAVSVVDA